MFKFIILFAIPAFILAQDLQSAVTTLFNFLDADSDGLVTKGEVSPFGQVLDADGDGMVSLTEFTAALAVNTAYAGFEQQLFNIFDLNGDGSIAIADFDTGFDTFDTDSDGSVTLAEFLAAASITTT